MTSEQIDKMEKWTMVMALMGQDRETMEADFYDENDGLLETLELLEKIKERQDNPDPVMTAVIQSMEMGVTSAEVYEYHDHVDEQISKQRQYEAEQKILNNSALIKLRERHAFAFIKDSKQYPKHCHFKFTMPGKIEVRGRVFNHSWREQRLWLKWTDNLGKKHVNLTKLDYTHSLVWPTVFPAQWRSNYSKSCEDIAYIIAWKQIHKHQLPTGMEQIKRVLPSHEVQGKV